MGHIGEGSSRLSSEVAKEVAVYFKRALAQAPERMDIQLGLCWTYANAGMRKEFVERFPTLKKYSGDKPGLQYNMAYARVVANEHSFGDGMAVFREMPSSTRMTATSSTTWRWERGVRGYIAKTKGNEQYKDHTGFAESLLPASAEYSFGEFEKSKAHEVPTYFQIINYEWVAKQFPSQFGGAFALADLMTYHNYEKATRSSSVLKLRALPRRRNSVKCLTSFMRGRCTKRAGPRANTHWKRLLASENFYRQSATNYFLGNYHYRGSGLLRAGKGQLFKIEVRQPL